MIQVTTGNNHKLMEHLRNKIILAYADCFMMWYDNVLHQYGVFLYVYVYLSVNIDLCLTSRSLSEKHSVLLRKFDRESKAMKRLSMDNEELSWRLSMSQSECGSPDSMRRSISHSPTNSETSTPEVTRRRKSPLPLPHSPLPHSPRSPCDPKRSPLQKTPPKNGSSMKRAGTYELLTQEYDDMNNIKQSDI